jgi:hypothetical protein
MSLSGGLARYHRIGAPTDPMRVLNDRPLECAVCHGDKTVGELIGKMESWWNKAYDRDVLQAAYGSLAANALQATATLGRPHEKAVALSLLGVRRDARAAAVLAAELEDPYPLVRDFAVGALAATFGPGCDLNLGAEPSVRDAEARRCAELVGISLPRGPKAPSGRPPDDGPAED